MIHPHTYIQFINANKGYGVFATKLIPKGSIVYVKDKLEIEIPPRDYALYDIEMQAHIEKYSYLDEKGIRVLSWDFAKYVNHCCYPNTLSTGFGFDIAIGDEITCDYGALNVEDEMLLTCARPNCRSILKPSDFESYYHNWDKKIKAALPLFVEVEQPLVTLLDYTLLEDLLDYLQDSSKYKSVYSLRYQNLLPS